MNIFYPYRILFKPCVKMSDNDDIIETIRVCIRFC